MATLLDLGLLNYFRPFFTFLLVWIIFYAVLQKIKIFGPSSGINALISFSAAMLFMFTPGVSDMVNIITPWFIVLMVFILLLAGIFMMVGVKESVVADLFSQDWFVWLIVIVAILFIFGFAFTKVFGSSIQKVYAGEGEASDAVFDVGRVLFHPRILGMLFLLLVVSQAIRLLSMTTK